MLRRVLQILAAIVLGFICYHAVIWVLGLLGLTVPPQLLLGIVVFLVIITILGSLNGKLDSWWI